MGRIITRKEWGARYQNGVGAARLPAQRLYLHHTVTAAVNGSASIRTIEQIGQNRFQAGMSYTFLCTVNGDIYNGVTVDRLSYHTGGYNDIARAISLVGNFETTDITEEQIQSVAWLVRYGHAQGWWPATLTGGHRDVKQTACPGINAYQAIPRINRLATAPPEKEDDDMKIRLCRDSKRPARGIHAVTPVGHWHIPNQAALEAFAYKWGLDAGKVEENDNTDWWGPDLGSVS